jgi:hypothetical protein
MIETLGGCKEKIVYVVKCNKTITVLLWAKYEYRKTILTLASLFEKKFINGLRSYECNTN